VITQKNRIRILGVSGLVAIFVVLVTPFIGMTPIPLDVLFNGSSGGVEADIFWRIRIPRVLIAFLAGMGLAVSGMAFQSMFRNPLATPFTLGVASGASLGAALFVQFGIPFVIWGISGTALAAFMGALVAILLVYGLTRLRGGLSTPTMLLAGVAISFFFSSAMLFTQYLSDFTKSFRILRWLMGGISVVGFNSLHNILPFVTVGCLIIIYLTHELNLMMSGEEIAISRGINIRFTKKILFFATSLMVGGVVSVCGPIGFIGLMAPHFSRLLIGNDHRYLTPMSLLFGGVFLTICDTFSRTLIAPAEIPVGVITALLGGPFFIWLLVRKSGSGRGMI